MVALTLPGRPEAGIAHPALHGFRCHSGAGKGSQVIERRSRAVWPCISCYPDPRGRTAVHRVFVARIRRSNSLGSGTRWQHDPTLIDDQEVVVTCDVF